MSSASTQFTPAQVLLAGQRAEAEGRLDYAVQFYRHLTDHLPGSPEAHEAREGLQRISRLRPPTGEVGPPREPPSRPYANGGGPPAAHSVPPPGPEMRPHRAAPPPTPQPPPPPPVPSHHGVPQPPLPHAMPHPAPVPAPAPTPVPVAPPPAPRALIILPAPVTRYRVGRAFATVFVVIGILTSVLGLGIVLAGVLDVGGLSRSLPAGGRAGVIGTGLIVLGTGLWVVFLSQLAKAVFDTANATCDLVAIERAKAGVDEID